MGLRDDLTADIAAAFDTDMADAVTALSGSRQVDGEYDPVTGEDTSTTVTYAGRGVFGGYRNDEIDGSLILATDTKLTALQTELLITEEGEPTEVLAAPKVGDTINGMRAQRISKDPAGATWSVQLRK